MVLNEFQSICPDVKAVKQVTKEHVLKFNSALLERGQSPRTAENKRMRVAAFLKFGGIDTRVVMPRLNKAERPEITTYTKVETDALLKYADDYMTVCISMALQLGLREQELMHAEFSDIQHDGTFRVQSKPEYDFVVKKQIQRDVPIPSTLIALLKTWKSTRPKASLVLGIGDDHKRVNGHLLRWAQRVGKKAGIEDVPLHKFRRTWLTALMRSGFDVATCQRFAAHKDLASTMRYLNALKASEPATRGRIDSIQW